MDSKRDTVSLLWSRLLEKELDRVKNRPDLRNRLLNLSESNLSEYETLYVQKLYTNARSICFFKRIVHYATNEASEELLKMPRFVNELASGLIDTKSSKKANHYRELGNRLFKRGDISMAAELYRTGLLHAPGAFPDWNESTLHLKRKAAREAILLHGNLSVVLGCQQNWFGCLWHVLQALKLESTNCCSDSLNETNSRVNRLWSRLTTCLNHLNFTSPFDDTRDVQLLHRLFDIMVGASAPSLVQTPHSSPLQSCRETEIDTQCPAIPRYGFHTKYVGLSAGVEVLHSESKGRYVVARRKFELGDVIAVEPASGWSRTSEKMSMNELSAGHLLLLPSQCMNRCHRCMAVLSHVGYVCPNCCDAAFCGPPSNCFQQGCTAKHTLSYTPPSWHVAECPFLFLLKSTGLGHLSFRLRWLQLNPSVDSSEPVLPLEELVDNFDHFVVEDLFNFAMTSWLLSEVMKAIDSCTVDAFADGLWCFDTLRRVQCNSHAVTEIQLMAPSLDEETSGPMNEMSFINPFRYHLGQVRVATGLFPCVSMLNHSCEPTVNNGFEGHFIVLRCAKSVEPSEEIFNCYGPHYLHTSSSDERRKRLREQYFFQCDCPHCLKRECGCVNNISSDLRAQGQLLQFQLLRSPNVPISCQSQLRDMLECIRKVCITSCIDCGGRWWPDDHTFGVLLNEIGEAYCNLPGSNVEYEKHISKQKINLLGIWFLKQSLDWVYSNYGISSPEYLWELIDFTRFSFDLLKKWPCEDDFINIGLSDYESRAIPNSLEECKQVISNVSSLLYGSRKAQTVVADFLPR